MGKDVSIRKEKTVSPKYGLILKLNHIYPENRSQNYTPTIRVFWSLLPLILRYIWYYMKHVLTGKSIVMDYVKVQRAKQIYEGTSNYIDWRYSMEIHLINCELWDYVDGTKDDEKMSKRSLAAIVSGVQTHIYTEIRELKTGKPVWDRLEKMYQSKDFSRIASLIEQLGIIRCSDCKNMDEYLTKKVKIGQQLKAIDNEMKDCVLAALIFVSLPDYYKTLIMALGLLAEAVKQISDVESHDRNTYFDEIKLQYLHNDERTHEELESEETSCDLSKSDTSFNVMNPNLQEDENETKQQVALECQVSKEVSEESHRCPQCERKTPHRMKGLKAWQSLLDGSMCQYTGLYPRAWTEYDLSDYGIKLSCRQISPIVPNDYTSTSLPCAVFVWDIENLADNERTVTISFTFKNGTGNKKVDKASTCSSKAFSYIHSEGVVLYHTLVKMQCAYALAAKPEDGVNISKCLYFDPNSDGLKPWIQLKNNGSFDKTIKTNHGHIFGEMACGIATKTTLAQSDTKQIVMSLAWDMPTINFPGKETKYNRFYTEKFGKENAVLKIVDFAFNNYDSWEQSIFDWQKNVLNDSQLPDWYKSALFNETYFISDGGGVWLSLNEGEAEQLSETDPSREDYVEGEV
ncbi:hypothetical protein NQ314_008196 [Rhamnusium bicolor]|uniref:Glycosyl-hydrolase family 116 N-terminal domain-containing protein n=1 Tax=Rhamnusium bicolor TaxID=1586634 RepID=A0AAV8YEQ7_9CUCU|nr:hypothetical protein NQ314_008196 [Rhamnusium bicolor]